MRGGTLHVGTLFPSRFDFNPPSPCGEGPPSWAAVIIAPRFQSTLPMRGGTPTPINGPVHIAFQSTLPMRGGTICSGKSGGVFRFQSTLPMRGGTRISTRMIDTIIFQSTLPMRGGTAQVHKIYLETYAHITKQAINRGTYSEAFKVFPHIMAYFAVFFYANLPGNLCLLPLRIIK